MASQNLDPNHKPVIGSLYCADPNCQYCKGLRATIEQLRNRGYMRPLGEEKQSATHGNTND